MKEQNCFIVDHTRTESSEAIVAEIAPKVGKLMSSVPDYRYTYLRKNLKRGIEPKQFSNLSLALPRFDFETGFACTMGNLFHLKPSAAEYEPGLFTRILPTLRQDDAFVMTLYIRTMASENKTGIDVSSLDSKYTRDVIQCAQQLESQRIEESGENRTFSKVVWLLMTDSPRLKQAVVEAYDGTQINTTKQQHSLSRMVLVTGSHGRHTRKQEPRTKEATKSSHADFAEAVIDWYLIGESDLVIENDWTFAHTAALRTNRPVYGTTEQKNNFYHSKSYKGKPCTRKNLLNGG